MDYLIGEPDAVGRGLGSEMIRRFAASLWERYPRAPSAIVAVLADNPASWRALGESRVRPDLVGPGPLRLRNRRTNPHLPTSPPVAGCLTRLTADPPFAYDKRSENNRQIVGLF